MTTAPNRLIVCTIAAAVLLAIAYSNHFHNGFHFDDSHAIQDNPSIRSLSNIPKFFADATTFSVLPLNQSYRPALQTTFAIDYWLGGGYRPLAFQIDTFIWYLVLLAAIASLFMAITQRAWITLVATAIYGLHPVCAETVNYIVQRGDLLSTLGVVAGLVLYIRQPAARRYGIYLVPVAIGALVKPPAVVFPALLAAYLVLFDRPVSFVRALIPAAVLTIVAAWWITHMTPPAATTGASDAAGYLWTQPFVALRYFSLFFWPAGLSADNDWPLLSPGDWRVTAGIAFVAALLIAIETCRRAPSTRPIAFGLWWFLIALLPTSLTPLAEVANDHRMFFPFVGLSLAVTVAAALLMRRTIASAARFSVGAVAIAIILIAEAVAVHGRNEIWKTDETLWRDVTEKSPRNGRGWMNYGLTLMARGDYPGALAAYERALPLTPNYHLLDINMAVALGQLGRAAEAEQHFHRAIALEPLEWRSHLHYARWLAGAGRASDALAHARISLELNPADRAAEAIAQAAARADDTPEYFLARSLAEYRMKRYRDSLASARRAIELRPTYAEGWNNIAAAHNALGEFEKGIAAGERAIQLNPSLQIARNNVEYARQQLQLRK